MIGEVVTPAIDPAPHATRGIAWSPAPVAPSPRNGLVRTLERAAALMIDVESAGLDAAKPIRIRADSSDPATVTLDFGGRSVAVELAAGHSDVTVGP